MIRTRAVHCLGLMALGVGAGPAAAFTATFVGGGPPTVYLQVGAGNGSFLGTGALGLTPNSTINLVSVTVPAGSVGTGTVNMSTDSTVTNSAYNNRPFCTVPAELYIGGYIRGGGGSAGTLRATAPASLTSGGDAIAFNTISWVSGGIGDATPTIPSGTFVGGTTQTLLTVPGNTFFESCLAFRYANSEVMPAGTFTGRVRYELTLP